MKKNITSVISAILLSIVLLPACKKNDDTPPAKTAETVTVGALLSLTGNWSTLGLTSKAAIEIAVEDINLYLRKNGASRKFAATVFDTKLDAGLASQYMAEAKEKGITFILGPQSSAEAAAVKPYADDHDMLVVSQGSTAGSLSIAGDNLFRFCPADNVEGAAMGRTIYNDGIRALVTIARDDAGNKGLQTATGSAFIEKGGSITPLTPYEISTSDFTSVVANIKTAITNFTSGHDAGAVAVYLASFDECVALFRAAAADSVLASVRWYGGDGVALSAALIGDAAAADFAIQTQFFAPAFGLPEAYRSKWEPLAEKIKARTGIEPDAFALATYDALWVMALSYEAAGSGTPGFQSLKTAFPLQARDYTGVTGPTRLNDAGDRESGSFDYWGITKGQDGAYKWVLKGRSE